MNLAGAGFILRLIDEEYTSAYGGRLPTTNKDRVWKDPPTNP